MPHPDDPPRAEVRTLRKGDQFVYQGAVRWTALEDVVIEGPSAHAEVRYIDGGSEVRYWDEPCEIPIRRAK